jgi:hypothetical protein
LAGCQGIDAFALTEIGEAKYLGSIAVRPSVSQELNLLSLTRRELLFQQVCVSDSGESLP